MRSLLFKSVMVFAVAAIMAACGGPNVATCSDDGVKVTTLEIIQDHLLKSPSFQEAQPSFTDIQISDIRTTARDEALKTSSCAAKYSFVYNDQPKELELYYNLAHLEDSGGTRIETNAGAIRARMLTLMMFQSPKRTVENQSIPKPAEPSLRMAPPEAAKLTPEQEMACVDKKLAAHRKEIGLDDAVVGYQQLDEWEQECAKGV